MRRASRPAPELFHSPLPREDTPICAARASVREVLDRYEIVPRKRLGQNFLHDPAVAERIVQAAGIVAGERVVEVGPGLGALTVPLLAGGAHVTAIEVDRHVVAYLRDTLGSNPALDLRHEDVLRVDLPAIAPEPATFLANVPYSITGPVLSLLIGEADRFPRAVLMVQREVGARLTAGSGGKEIGAPAVVLRLLYDVERLFDVGTGAFIPRPDVVSVVLRLTRRAGTRLPPELRDLVNLAYRQRRKMLRKTLGPELGSEAAVAAALETLGHAPTARPEDLEPDEWPVLVSRARGGRVSARALAALALLLAWSGFASPVLGEDDASGGGPPAGSSGSATDTSGAASSDTTGARREFISTDGSVSVYEEATPGEGLEGFWWEYDAKADLQRLLDKDRRGELLDPVVDPFGFELAIPESIRGLRDSVMAVADSILAETIDVTTTFDPKFKSTYNEDKDNYSLKNSFDASLPLTGKGTVSTRLTNDFTFNEATKRTSDSRAVQSTFNFQFREGLVSSVAINRTDDAQELDGVPSSESDNTSLNGTFRATGAVSGWKTEGNLGLSANQRNYFNSGTTTEGTNGAVSPSWGARLSRELGTGSFSMDYKGDVGASFREEFRRVTVTDSAGVPILDENGQAVTERVRDESNDDNFRNTVNSSLDYKFSEGNTIRVNGGFSRDSRQFLSQVPDLRGQQETRVTASRSVRSMLNSKPFEALSFVANAEIRRSENLYDLQTELTAITTTRSADVDVTYNAWKGGRFLVKFDRSHEDRNRTTVQAGIVENTTTSADFKQQITPNVEFNATYYITLDTFAFDDPDSNKGDRDLLNQRSTFVVRYKPKPAVTTAVKMEIRRNDSVNIHRTRSGDNKIDYTYLITPDYTWKVGSANFSGDFTADVRYSVFDFREEDNDLIRRFSTRQKWQHAFSERFSTSLLATYEFSDQGAYSRSSSEERRRFSKTREIRRSKVDAQLLYKPKRGIELKAGYKRDADDTFAVSDGERTLSDERRTYEFTWGLTWNRNVTRHAKLNLRFSQTRKKGDRISEFDRNFYRILASLEYQPFKKQRQGAN